MITDWQRPRSTLFPAIAIGFCVFTGGMAKAETGRVEVRIEGPTTVDWGQSRDYEIAVYLDGKRWKALPLVTWRVRGGDSLVETDRRNTGGRATVRLQDPKKDFYSRDFIVEAEVIAETPAGRVERVVTLKVTASNVARLCGQLADDIKRVEDNLDRLRGQRDALQERHDGMKVPDVDRAALAAAERAGAEAREDSAAAKGASDAADEVVDEIGASRNAVDRTRWTAWRNMTDSARYTAANDRYAVSARSDRDKLAYIETVFGRKQGVVKTTQNKVRLEQDFEEARNHVQRHVGTTIAKALAGIGTLAVIALPGPKATGGRVLKYAKQLASAYQKVKKAKKFFEIIEFEKRVGLSDSALRSLSNQSGIVRDLAEQYRRARSDSERDRLFGRLMAALKVLHNRAIDALHRTEDALEEARDIQRAARKAAADAKKALDQSNHRAQEEGRRIARAQRAAEQAAQDKRRLAGEIRRATAAIGAGEPELTELRDRHARNCQPSKPRAEPVPEEQVKCKRRGLVGSVECVEKHIEKGR